MNGRRREMVGGEARLFDTNMEVSGWKSRSLGFVGVSHVRKEEGEDGGAAQEFP